MQASVGYVGRRRVVVKSAQKSFRIINEVSGERPIELNRLTGLLFRYRTAQNCIFKKKLGRYWPVPPPKNRIYSEQSGLFLSRRIYGSKNYF